VPVILAIDTSTRWAGVGLTGAGEPIELAWHSQQNHGAELMDKILQVLRDRDASVADIDCVAVAIGPGGFSALRVGLATAKGLVAPTGNPIIGISTFDLEAMSHWPTRRPLVATIDAGSSGLAWARYVAPKAQHSRPPPEFPLAVYRVETGLCLPQELVKSAPASALFCGERAPELGKLVGEARILSSEPPTRRPQNLALLAGRRLADGDVDDPMTLQPEYARPPSISKSNK
jgi:tRNA threonylcarbamoyladenosine biosynthesis protein TsaB